MSYFLQQLRFSLEYQEGEKKLPQRTSAKDNQDIFTEIQPNER